MANKEHNAQLEESVQDLIATGLYKSKSQAIRERLRNLGSQPPSRSLSELRQDLDNKLANTTLSQAVQDMRERETH